MSDPLISNNPRVQAILDQAQNVGNGDPATQAAQSGMENIMSKIGKIGGAVLGMLGGVLGSCGGGCGGI